MNSRSGTSTPVDIRSTETTTPGSGRLRNWRIICKGLSARPVILRTNDWPRPKMFTASSTSWSAWEVRGTSLSAKISVLGKRPYFCSWARAYFLTSSRILRLESGEVTLRSTSVGSNSRWSSSWSSCSLPVSGSTIVTVSPSLRKTPCIRTSDLTVTTS